MELRSNLWYPLYVHIYVQNVLQQIINLFSWILFTSLTEKYCGEAFAFFYNRKLKMTIKFPVLTGNGGELWAIFFLHGHIPAVQMVIAHLPIRTGPKGKPSDAESCLHALWLCFSPPPMCCTTRKICGGVCDCVPK